MTRAAVLALLALPAAADVVDQPRAPVVVECFTPGAAGRYGALSPTWGLGIAPSERLRLDNPRIGGPTPIIPPVPLPAAGLMLGSALALLAGLMLWRRRRA